MISQDVYQLTYFFDLIPYGCLGADFFTISLASSKTDAAVFKVPAVMASETAGTVRLAPAEPVWCSLLAGLWRRPVTEVTSVEYL